jgi:D-threo-aldose 1-dehydrogenase
MGEATMGRRIRQMKLREIALDHDAKIKVSEIGFGSAPLGDLYERLGEETAFATLKGACSAGITLFDTSPHYGNGLSELRCGAALRGLPRDSFVLSTKVGRRMEPFERAGNQDGNVISPGFAGGIPHRSVFDYSFDGTKRCVEQSLLRLGLDRIDILLIHDVDVWTHGRDKVDERFREAMSGAYKALDQFRTDGVVKAIGVGLNEADMCERFAQAGDFDVMLLAGRYSLLEQPAIQSFLPMAEKKHISIMLGGVFNSGILATGAIPGARYDYRPAPPDIVDRVRRIEAVCARYATPLRRAALHFALAHPAVVSVVLGGVKPSEVSQNVHDVEQAVPSDLWAELKRTGLISPSVPTPS